MWNDWTDDAPAPAPATSAQHAGSASCRAESIGASKVTRVAAAPRVFTYSFAITRGDLTGYGASHVGANAATALLASLRAVPTSCDDLARRIEALCGAGAEAGGGVQRERDDKSCDRHEPSLRTNEGTGEQ
jgi:hypothetical protein